ncbi:DNA mismatch repair protein MutS [Pseudomonas aeruginosa]|uniref:MutS-related protein n=1 Tax=Pseudomonas aeruginosa TaxID=287 RepID=UPI000FFEAD1C|nr:DNA mismatch repair protein MutS [Pseudomonas aeruginosa]MBG4604143.1 DNA mismatch repair protein MutS [Pseudomonas aeruginosa]MBH8257435.1 DNA mismatch repair protein MutS [Pseudomonas aeruginosa]MCV3907742.1 DNA mismatch repair protein MutS [Pseudomonas aeruginosa]NPS39650.1 DNA mismatch repair protein MutS [Pseudomonas aeruginosa]NPS89122.1 DNA mismatch repair protein MutS [Pseudomonas aeruginosa]
MSSAIKPFSSTASIGPLRTDITPQAPDEFHSILFPAARRPSLASVPPPCFKDLNLDQVVDAITADRHEYDLEPFFYTHLDDLDAIVYRQEVMRDLLAPSLLGDIQAFAANMRAIRRLLVPEEKLYYPRQQQRSFVEAVRVYCDALRQLAQALVAGRFESRGLRGLLAYLERYLASDRFLGLEGDTQHLLDGLGTITYSMLIKDNQVRVQRYEPTENISTAIDKTFAKFRQGDVRDYHAKFNEWPAMNHVEAAVLDMVAKLYPDLFAEQAEFCTKHADFQDEAMEVFDREIQFYLAYLAYIQPLVDAGMPFCFPGVRADSKAVFARDAFDLALASRLVRNSNRLEVVCNDFELSGQERILVVSGPNQGGKTTFARLFGQLHYLACIGCLVPAESADLFLYDRLFTLFEKQERPGDLRGKLQDDLLRAREILSGASARSLVLINEIFASTTASDAAFLGQKILGRIIELDALCVCVTFIYELTQMGDSIVSMMSCVDADDPSRRTFKVLRKPADRLSYALSIARKHRLSYDNVKERIRP